MLTCSSFLCCILIWQIEFTSLLVEAKIKPGYPNALASKKFKDTFEDSMWTFGEEFSPSGDLMYRSIGHHGVFFAEYYFKSVGDNKQIVFSCKKYEVTENSRINIWAFSKVFKQYNDSMLSLCDVCHGLLQFKTTLTDIESNLPASNVSTPDLSDPKTPLLSSCDEISRGSFILTEHILVRHFFVLICSCMYFIS